MRSEQRQDVTPPLWMRRGTIWTILALAAGAGALIAYYLLPMWWAQLISFWVEATNSWVVGIVLGTSLLVIGVLSSVWALRVAEVRQPRDLGRPKSTSESASDAGSKSSSKSDDRLSGETKADAAVELAPTSWREWIRPVLAAVAGVCLVTLALTVFITSGLTEPLKQARQLWLADAPGVLVATLVGVLLGAILLLSGATLKATWANHKLQRRRQPPAKKPLSNHPEVEDYEAGKSKPDDQGSEGTRSPANSESKLGYDRDPNE